MVSSRRARGGISDHRGVYFLPRCIKAAMCRGSLSLTVCETVTDYLYMVTFCFAVSVKSVLSLHMPVALEISRETGYLNF